MEAAASENSYSKEIFCIDVKKEKEGTTPSCIGVFFSLKSLCGGGVPFSHPSLGLSVFFLSFSPIPLLGRLVSFFLFRPPRGRSLVEKVDVRATELFF